MHHQFRGQGTPAAAAKQELVTIFWFCFGPKETKSFLRRFGFFSNKKDLEDWVKKEGEGSVVYIYIYADHACHTSDLVIEEDSHTKMEKSEEESSNVGEGEEEEEEEEEIMPLGKKKKKEEEEFVPTIIKREEEEEEQFHDQISERAQQLSPEQQKIVDLVAQGKV